MLCRYLRAECGPRLEEKQVQKISEEVGQTGARAVENTSLRNSFISLILFGETQHGICHHRLQKAADISFSS